MDGLGEELGRYGLTDEVAEECQDDVPRSGTDGGVEEEATERHTCQPRRDRDELTDPWDKTSDERGADAVLHEVSFSLLDLLPTQQAEATDAGVSELIHDRAAEIACQIVVDERTYIRAERGEEYNEEDIHLARSRLVGSRGYDDL